jgi:hypothetical protein
LLEVIEVLTMHADCRRSILFAFWDGEEGLRVGIEKRIRRCH